MTVFPRTFEEQREKLVDNSLVIARGRLEERDEGDVSTVGILLDQLMDVEAALEDFRGGFVIQVDARDRDKLTQLKDLVAEHRGDKRLFLEVEGTDGKVRRVHAGERSGVKISAELSNSIEKLLGPGRAKLARL